MQRKGNLLALFVDMQIDTATTEDSAESPQKIKNKATM